ncbi:WD40-like Beta Propeller Repeat [Aquimarina amphilecti]|uniref:WD40-like Beta Propeller Repeat n=1 Tax=Aquimarina amphilecti TaxID=1038014 RepID=A0A1H7T1T4_AQUAM|nr:PD40 domain-containing protein [Aquimarina amphilecti]SEL78485.1 WD40-like Beta Propeller Repeat [Aquimarina amphilecti]
MKPKTLIACIVFCSWLSQPIQSQSISNSKPITEEGEYSTPVWSPDGQKILFTDHHNDELFVIDLIHENKITKVKNGQGIGYLANWSTDSKSIIFREKPKDGLFSDILVKSINLKTKAEKTLNNVHPDNTDLSLQKKSNKNLIVYINLQTLKLEAKEGINGKPWVITKEEGQYYHPIVSPDQKQVVVHEGPNIYLYPIYKKQERISLGYGLASSWLPNNNGVITFEDKSIDGHTISASDLFYISAKTVSKTQLTNSNDIIETWGDVSPDGKRIAFSDEKSGRIFIADLNFKN